MVMKYIWKFSTFLFVFLFIVQVIQTNKITKQYTDLKKVVDNADYKCSIDLETLCLYNRLVERLCIERNNVTRQSVVDFFTYNNFCYVTNIEHNNPVLLDLCDNDSVFFDSALELIDCQIYFLFNQDKYIGTIDAWTTNCNPHLDWYIRNHSLFRFE